MAGPRIVERLDDRTVIVAAPDGSGHPWLYVGGVERLPAEEWGCACRFCAGNAEQVPYAVDGEFMPLTFSRAHVANSRRPS